MIARSTLIELINYLNHEVFMNYLSLSFKLFYLVLSLLSLKAYSQPAPFLGGNTAQSPRFNWFKLENEWTEVFYPEGQERRARETLELIKYYSQFSGETYGISKPKKFPLVLRPENALPNGFVTLGPRRSEWFIQEAYNPLIGGLRFDQGLAIHEYRHVTQFDFNDQSINKIAYGLLGEQGLSLMISIGLPNWFMEGDAVWAETAYTDGGRGRSPRFSSRLKGLVLSGQLPTYDEFIGRSYNTILPNHYVFGYYLVTRAYRLFGEDFWKKVVSDVTGFALNPYRIYSKFEDNSGVSFKDFYDQTLLELQNKWKQSSGGLKKVEKFGEGYQELAYPVFDNDLGYVWRLDLDSYWTLIPIEAGEEQGELISLPISPSRSKVDIKAGKVAYTQFLPDLRYSYRSFSDLYTYDLNSHETQRLSKGERFYHPSFSASGRRLVATHNNKDEEWTIKAFDLNNKTMETIPLSSGLTPLEAVFKDNDNLFILAQNKVGEKGIITMPLFSPSYQTVLPFSRNNLFSLRSAEGGVLFEADYKGEVQVFYLKESELKICSKAPIAAFQPSFHKGKLLFISERENGGRLESVPFSQCRLLAKSAVTGIERLSNGPSDNYTNKEPLAFPSILTSNNPEPEEMGFFRGSKPHSWNFVGGRGYQVQLLGDNYQGSFSYSGTVGYSATEERPYTSIILSYNELYPTISLYGGLEGRKSTVINGGPIEQWEETQAGLLLGLPFTWVNGFNNFRLHLGAQGGILKTTAIPGAGVNTVNNETLDFYGGDLSFSWLRDMTSRQIYPSWGARFRAFWRTVASGRRTSFDSDLLYFQSSVFLPGALHNHGMRIQGTTEKQTSGNNNFRHSAVGRSADNYVFSRGFAYGYVDEYRKLSLDYTMPLWDADWNLLNFHYLKRLSGVVFHDYTDLRSTSFKGHFQSYGGELRLETTLFRRLPLIYGLRYSNKVDRDSAMDVFLGTDLSF